MIAVVLHESSVRSLHLEGGGPFCGCTIRTVFRSVCTPSRPIWSAQFPPRVRSLPGAQFATWSFMVTLTHSPIQCFVVACSESMLF